jgi:hypothetical protein
MVMEREITAQRYLCDVGFRKDRKIKDMVITIDKIEVLDDVKREAEYVASRGGDWDHTRIIDADDELLDRWLSDACSGIMASLGDVIVEAYWQGDAWRAVTTHDNNKVTSANVLAQTYVEQRLLTEWMLMVNQKERAEVYGAKATEKIAELKRVVMAREIIQ